MLTHFAALNRVASEDALGRGRDNRLQAVDFAYEVPEPLRSGLGARSGRAMPERGRRRIAR